MNSSTHPIGRKYGEALFDRYHATNAQMEQTKDKNHATLCMR